MAKRIGLLAACLSGAIAFGMAAPARAVKLEVARIFIEYNSSANDLGFQVFLDGEDWKTLEIVNPNGTTIFNVAGKAAYQRLGLTELFFEGAEPSLDEFPLEQLLALFPEGKYKFAGLTVAGRNLTGTAVLTHDVPDAPSVSTTVNGDSIVIQWDPVTGPAPILPDGQIQIAGYQIIVDPFQVTLPASSTRVTLPPEFAASLAPGAHPFEVLAIDVSGNQTITEGSFDTQ